MNAQNLNTPEGEQVAPNPSSIRPASRPTPKSHPAHKASPPCGATAYPFCTRSINRQVADMVTENDALGYIANIFTMFPLNRY
ncbi:hypothetical protein TNCV_1653611 [Trichonephila clavipes]|nr:hypothetical protein TNCV_1653611 [Trichonephila clavipes]